MDELLKTVKCKHCDSEMLIGVKDIAEYKPTFIEVKYYVDYVKDLMKGEEKNSELLEDVLEQTELVAIHQLNTCCECDEYNPFLSNDFEGDLISIVNGELKTEFVEDLTFIDLSFVVGVEEYNRLHELLKDVVRKNIMEAA